jgi:cytoskeletal protein CcmA (bactofilin family)
MMVDANNDANRRKTLVEEGTQFKGSLSSSCSIEVNGRFEGDLTAPALAVNPGGAVRGKVKVSELESQGELAGDFDADVVRLAGTVKDNTVIRAKSLEVTLAAPTGKMQVVFGECELEIGEEPRKVEAIDESAARRPSERPRRPNGGPAPEAVASKSAPTS